MTARKQATVPAPMTADQAIALLRSGGSVGTSNVNGRKGPVTFGGTEYASIPDFVATADWSIIAAVTPEDLSTCGVDQAKSVLSRAVNDRAKREAAAN